MKKGLPLAASTFLSLAALLLARLWLQRVSLPYNEEGRYFDVDQTVIYDESAHTVVGLLTALCAFAAFTALLWTVRAWRR